jgi:hypothetical protein
MDWPGIGDPWHDDNTSDNGGSRVNGGRRSYYNVGGLPYYYVDGTRYTGGATADGFGGAIQNRARRASPLSISMSCEIVDGELITVIEVTSEDDLNGLTLFVALNEYYYNYRGANGQNNWYHPMVKMIPDWEGSDFDIDANATQEFEFSQNMEGLGWHDLELSNLIAVCWVQNSNREVLQAQNSYMTTIVNMDEWELSDADGNDDGRPEPGETIDMFVSLSVPGNRMSANECLVSLFCNDDELEFTNSEFNPGEIRNGEQITNEDNPFSFSVPNDMVAHPVNFVITVEAQPGDWAAEYEFELMIGWPDILLIDVTEDAEAAEAMMGVFGDHDLPWVDYLDLIEEIMIPDGLLSHYDAVLWHTFNSEESMYFEFEELALADYLDNGGTVIISSPYTVLHYGNIEFFSEYMGAGLENPDLSSRYVYSYEGSGDFEGANLFLGGGDGAGFAAATPGLSVEGSGEAVLYYPNGDQVAGIAGIQNVTDDFRTLLLSFPIESIGGAASTDERYEFVGRIWNWINGENDVFKEDDLKVYDFNLDVAYPNPFNSTSVIPFSLTQSDNISLKLFNVAGREIGQIASGNFKAGAHKVTLDASKFGLTTGVYYLQLDGKNGTSIGKVLYIR